MNHADIKRHLADYLEGELAIDTRALVDAHLDVCDSCSDEVEQMLETIQVLRRLPEPEIPPFIAANVMRRIRLGESQLGFFGRLGRTLSGVFEPGFVLPASAIAAAALVVTVVQGVGGDSIPNFGWDAAGGGEETRGSGVQTQASVASLAPSIAKASRSGGAASARVGGRSSAPNGMDFVARVERRATQADRTRSRGRRGQASFVLTGPGTQIRIQLNGLGLMSRVESQPSPIQIPLMPRLPNGSTPAAGSLLVSQSTELWATDFSGVMSRYASGVAGPGTLVAAESQPSSDLLTLAATWPQQSITTQGGFLTGGGNAKMNAEGRDPRDAWLDLAFEDPAEFARYIAGRNLAEQELWAGRLSERAETRGLLDELLRTLRDSGDPTAGWVADDFSAQAELARRFHSDEN